ncbi:MAG: hypothetical protein QG597_2280 [Actinomycetota bacterium]|nr:hypothetical protein [Actinomycetota bacterium]
MGIGAADVRHGVGDVHGDLIAAAGGLLAPLPASPVPPADDTDQPDVYMGGGVPSPGKAGGPHAGSSQGDHPKAPPYPGTAGGSPYGAPAGPLSPPQQRTPFIGPGANGTPPSAPAVGWPISGEPPSPPMPPQDSGGLSDGAGRAGDDYQTKTGQAQGLDDRLTQEINDAVSSNQQARDRITGILNEMKTYQAGVVASNDPLALSNYQKYLDQKLSSVQQILDDAKVTAQSKQQILSDIASEYRATGGSLTPPAAASEVKQSTGQDQTDDSAVSADPSVAGGEVEGGEGDIGGGGGQDTGQGGQGLVDPFAGLGMNPMMGAGMGDALGALGGLGGLGGSLGSSLAGLGSAPFGALAPALGSLGGLGALGQLGGSGSGFTDQPPTAPKDPGSAFKDDRPDPGAGNDPAGKDTSDKATESVGDKSGNSAQPTKPAAAEAGFTDSDSDQEGHHGTAERGARATTSGDQSQGAPVAAAPASTPGGAPAAADAGKSVTLPDGTPVTASNEKAAGAARAVLAGQSVTEAYKAQGIDIPPPGTPVTHPVGPSKLEVGDIARFGTKPPVMAMGNGKIWMDGQLQPLSAMGSSSDFLGWTKPPDPVMTAAAHAPVPPSPAQVPAPVPPPPIPQPAAGQPS